MLQRIYGVAFQTAEQLKAYLHILEEAEKRDHRKLGREMDLFHMQEEAPRQVFWHPNGWTVYTTLAGLHAPQADARRLCRGEHAPGRRPQAVGGSGHWDKYQEHMFIVEVDEEHAREKTINALKPMNCPCHVQIFNQGLKSYRDLPLRMAEFGSCNRYEPSGALHGLMRVRGFTQDDAHIFCTEDQIEARNRPVHRLSVRRLPRHWAFPISRSNFPPAREARRRTRSGTSRGGAEKAIKAVGQRLRDRTRRRRLLRAQAGIRADRRDRAGLAMRHLPGRFRSCPNGWMPPISAQDGEKHRPSCCTAPAWAASSASSAS